jgi:hypothetical protein
LKSGHRTEDKAYKKGASIQDKRYTQNRQTAQKGALHSRAERCTPNVLTSKEELRIGQLSLINADKMQPASPQCNAVMYKRGVAYGADVNKPEIGSPSMRKKMMAGGRWRPLSVQSHGA